MFSESIRAVFTPGHVMLVSRSISSVLKLPSVLTEQLCGRLALVNGVARILRKMGYQVVRQQLDAPTRPKLTIELKKDQSIIPLLDAGETLGWITEEVDGEKVKYGYVVFEGVGVLWRVS